MENRHFFLGSERTICRAERSARKFSLLWSHSKDRPIRFARKIRIAHGCAEAYAVITMTFLMMTADAILETGLPSDMPTVRPKQIHPGNSWSSDGRLNDARLSDDRSSGVRSNSARSNGDPRWNAVLARDSVHDGDFVFAVATTGVYCRPSCPRPAAAARECEVLRPSRPGRESRFPRLPALPPASHSQPIRKSDLTKEICRYIEQHLDEPITLERLGKSFRQSPFHLQRRFKGALGITPREYADSCRLRLLKRNLQAGDNVTRAMYDAGYGSSSRLYEKTASQLGMTPDKYRRGAIAATVRYAFADSPLGRMLIAATDRGDLRHPVRAVRWRVDRGPEARISLCRAQARRRRPASLGERRCLRK